jgi:hypothetical protein
VKPVDLNKLDMLIQRGLVAPAKDESAVVAA